jgi:hypothetical protein
LYSIAVGKTVNLDSLANNLNIIIKQYPEAEIAKSAKDILAKMKEPKSSNILFDDSKTSVVDTSNQEIAEVELYKFEENTAQQVLIIFENKKIDVKRFEFDLINFNTDFFSMLDFNVNSTMIDTKNQMTIIKPFIDVKQAKTYYDALLLQTELMKTLNGIKHEIFIISSDNYPAFYNDKDFAKYSEFFKKNYLKL